MVESFGSSDECGEGGRAPRIHYSSLSDEHFLLDAHGNLHRRLLLLLHLLIVILRVVRLPPGPLSLAPLGGCHGLGLIEEVIIIDGVY